MAIYSFSSRPHPLISEVVNPDLGIVVCIPAFNEKQVDKAVRSLLARENIPCKIDIIVLINEASTSPFEVKSCNRETYLSLLEMRNKLCIEESEIQIFPIYVKDIPQRKGGVGLARKLAMDEAAHRLMLSNSHIKIISSFDADATCSSNYFDALWSFFEDNKELSACSIYFEHPYTNNDPYSQAIIKYELHLRYYKNLRKWIGLPSAFYTLGSCMAVLAESYIKMGGMNTRKAGEDFYFLHKYIKINKCGELTGTTIFPSNRISNRVPFGTGKAISEIIQNDLHLSSYNPQSFVDFRSFIQTIDQLFLATSKGGVSFCIKDLPEAVKHFLYQNQADEKLWEVKINSTNFESFVKRFFQRVDAFFFMKYLHFARDNYYPNVELPVAIQFLFEVLHLKNGNDQREQLEILREFDKKGNIVH